MTLPNIEILKINDTPSSPIEDEQKEPFAPHERQIVQTVIDLWKSNPETEDLGALKLLTLVKAQNPLWQLSEKRFKQTLKQYNLLNNSSTQNFSYANQITSVEPPNLDLPAGLRIQFTKNRGKGLYANKAISEGDLIWEEKAPLFFVPPLDHLNLMNSGKACCYCGTLIKENTRILKGLDCNVCNNVWCSVHCKRTNTTLHQLLNHTIFSDNANSKKVISSNNWKLYTKFCYENKWNAAYAVGLIHAYCITDKSGILQKQFDALAKVRQDVRYKALDSNSSSLFENGALFIQEQQEQLWNAAFERFNKCFPKHQISFEKFMFDLGSYNINNIDGSIFLIQSNLNHNCDPNVRVVFGNKKSDGIKVYAKRDIKSNEELVTTYVNPAHDLNQRQRELRINWGFNCNCNKCKSDAKEKQRRKSNENNGLAAKPDIKKMLNEANNKEFDLEIPAGQNTTTRRKSVRFDEKVIAVSNQ